MRPWMVRLPALRLPSRGGVFWKWLLQDSGAIARRENEFAFPLPRLRGRGERNDARGGKYSPLAQAFRPQAPPHPPPQAGEGDRRGCVARRRIAVRHCKSTKSVKTHE